MTVGEVDATFSYLAARPAPDVLVLSGGEPLLARSTPRILTRTAAVPSLQSFHLHTTAVWIDRVDPELLRATAPRRSATVGIHGPRAGVHEGITGVVGSFRRAVAGVARLLELGFALRAAVVLTESNADFIEDTTAFLLGLGFGFVEVRLPVIGPGMSSELVPSAQVTRRPIESWLGRFATDPRASLVAGGALCYGTALRDLAPRDDEFLFFDADHQMDEHQRAPGQLSAIWLDFHGDYRKTERCGSCAVAAVCPGYSASEIQKGHATPTPISLDNILGRVG